MRKLLAAALLSVLFLLTVVGCAASAEMGDRIPVYEDFESLDNHFNMKAMMCGEGCENLVIPMNEEWRENPASGETCIRCQINTKPDSWGGWLFLTGILREGDTLLSFNDGAEPDQGENLTGMRELRFKARGQNGGEHVEFLCFGFGDGDQSIAYPDTADKKSVKIDLSAEWTEYDIPVDGLDLTNIICGFGFACNSGDSGTSETIFYLDDICYVG